MRVAILGFGFGGLMVTANLVRAGVAPLTLYLIAPKHDARGAAYGTTATEHLLNVRAGNMGAWGDAPGDFAQWLATDAGKYAAALRKVKVPAADDFAPRALYGDYLETIWRDTQSRAAEKKILLKLVPALATRISRDGETLAVMTDRGDAIAVDAAVLATGVEPKPILTHLPQEQVVQQPWQDGALDHAGKFMGPIVLMGTGLTAVDAVLSLRKAQYRGEIIALSRRGQWPQPHRAGLASYSLDAAQLTALRPAALLHFLRRAAKGGEWRSVVDALRPYTQDIWQRWNEQDQRRFLARLLAYWNTHRHRLAPEIAAQLDAEHARGKLRTLTGGRIAATVVEGRAQLEVIGRRGREIIAPSLIVNCTGPELAPAKSAQSLLPQLLQSGLAEAHRTGLGFAADRQNRLWGGAYPHLYAIGAPLTGQLLESTAVPELRQQAQSVAQQILSKTA